VIDPGEQARSGRRPGCQARPRRGGEVAEPFVIVLAEQQRRPGGGPDRGQIGLTAAPPVRQAGARYCSARSARAAFRALFGRDLTDQARRAAQRQMLGDLVVAYLPGG
jgi:hypothetical protein